jgi:hypothetical protein
MLLLLLLLLASPNFHFQQKEIELTPSRDSTLRNKSLTKFPHTVVCQCQLGHNVVNSHFNSLNKDTIPTFDCLVDYARPREPQPIDTLAYTHRTILREVASRKSN